MFSKIFIVTTFVAIIFVTTISSDYKNKNKTQNINTNDNKEIQVDSIDLSEWQEFQEFKKLLKEQSSVGNKDYKKYEKTYCSNNNKLEITKNNKNYYKKKYKEHFKNDENVELDPPPINKAALMARYIVNQAGMLYALFHFINMFFNSY